MKGTRVAVDGTATGTHWEVKSVLIYHISVTHKPTHTLLFQT